MIKNSLKFQLALVSIVLGVALLVVQAILQYQALRDELVTAREGQQLALITEFAGRLDDELKARVRALTAAAADIPQPMATTVAAQESFLAGQGALLTLFDDLYLFSPSGVLLADWPVRPGRRGLDMKERDYIKSVTLHPVPYISKPILGRATKEPIVVIAAPVLDARGQLVAIIGGVLNLYRSNLLGNFVRRRNGENGYFYVLSSEGQFIAHPRHEMVFQNADPPNLTIGETDSTAMSGSGITPNGKSLVTYMRLPSTDWVVAGSMPIEEAYRSLDVIRRRMLTITLALILVSLPLLWFFARQLLAPLDRLADAMSGAAARMKPGMQALPVHEAGSDEVRQVARAFNNFLSARNMAEANLAQSQRRLSLVVENVTDGIWDWDILAQNLYVNPAMRDMLELEPGLYIQTLDQVLGALHPQDAQALRAAIDECLAGRRTLVTGEYRVPHPHTGYTTWIAVSGRIVAYDNTRRPQRMLGTMVNISSRREQMEQLAQAKAEAEAASESKSNFLANMSHEIRTPMNGIMGMTALCLQTPLSETQRGYLEMVEASANSLLAVINDILDFSKIEARRLELDPHAYDLYEMLRQTMRTLSLRASEKQLELVLDMASDVPMRVVGDPARLRQVITNLVGNAVKFTSHGEIVVRVAPEPAARPIGANDWAQPGSGFHLRFSILDTGIGIPADKLGSIFEAFTQADASTARRYGGTGLGLAISKSLVELMGGSIGVTSEEGKGSEFSFVVGLSRDTETGVVALPSVVAPGTRGRALLVEGNVSQRMAVRGILIRDGWTVDEVSGCREAEALDASQVACYDLAIVDCTQSDGCGVTLARDLSAASGLQTPLPCVMLCTLGDETATREIRAETAPPVPMLLKPVDASELRAAIEQALTGSVVPAADAGTDATPLTPSTLPSPETEAAPPPVESPAPARRELRVLLAEDAPINQKLAEAVLRRMGHEVTVARNGVEAVSLVQEQRFDIVLMDIQMPEMGGVEATERIRHFEMAKGMARIPIVAVTANALKGDRENYLAAGMDGYVSKPIVFAALEAEIERVTRGV